jgi:peptidoglycan hydrolase CwlO-like protein
MEKEKFTAKFSKAEKSLRDGSDHDRLDFICLSFNTDADDMQLRQGIEVLQSYIDDHQYASGNILGLKVLTERLNEAIVDKDKALQSLAMEKKRLAAEVQSLQEKLQDHETLVGKLQQQIEEIKNIENIIKSREAEQP